MTVSRVLRFVVLGCLGLIALVILLWISPIPIVALGPAGFASPLLASAILGGGALTALPCAVTRERGRLRHLMLAGMLAALAAVLCWASVAILGPWLNRESASMVALVAAMWCTGMAVVTALVALTYRQAMGSWFERAAALAFVLASVGTALLLIGMATIEVLELPRSGGGAGVLRSLSILLGPGCMMVAAATLAAARVHARMSAPPADGPPGLALAHASGHASGLGRVSLRCPRCQVAATLPMGGAGCPACGLRITVEAA